MGAGADGQRDLPDGGAGHRDTVAALVDGWIGAAAATTGRDTGAAQGTARNAGAPPLKPEAEKPPDTERFIKAGDAGEVTTV